MLENNDDGAHGYSFNFDRMYKRIYDASTVKPAWPKGRISAQVMYINGGDRKNLEPDDEVDDANAKVGTKVARKFGLDDNGAPLPRAADPKQADPSRGSRRRVYSKNNQWERAEEEREARENIARVAAAEAAQKKKDEAIKKAKTNQNNGKQASITDMFSNASAKQTAPAKPRPTYWEQCRALELIVLERIVKNGVIDLTDDSVSDDDLALAMGMVCIMQKKFRAV
jgi:hypothetical protein